MPAPAYVEPVQPTDLFVLYHNGPGSPAYIHHYRRLADRYVEGQPAESLLVRVADAKFTRGRSRWTLRDAAADWRRPAAFDTAAMVTTDRAAALEEARRRSALQPDRPSGRYLGGL